MSAVDDLTDCVILGAGPAGLSAARWLHGFQVGFRWFSTEGRVGGLLRQVNNRIENYPGGSYGSGEALIAAFESHFDQGEHFRSEIGSPQTGRSEIGRPEAGQVRRVFREPADQTGPWQLAFDDRPPLSARTVILATGTRYRRLEVPGEAEALGQCVSQSATADGERFRGETVAVVGAGDAGFENALRLAEHDCKVWMLVRSEPFKARPSFVERVESHPKIAFYPVPTTVAEVCAGKGANGMCRLLLDVAGDQETLDVACLFVRIGVEPVTPAIAPAPRMRDGFLVVDRDQRTSLEGLFAAGDITDCLLRSVATAVGTGATAAKAAAVHLGHL